MYSQCRYKSIFKYSFELVDRNMADETQTIEEKLAVPSFQPEQAPEGHAATSAVPMSLTGIDDQSSDGSFGYEAMDDDQFNQAAEKLFNERLELIGKLMRMFEEAGYKVGKLKNIVYHGFDHPCSFPIELPSGMNTDPFLGKKIKLVVATTAPTDHPRLATMYVLPYNNDVQCVNTAFLQKNKEGKYKVRVWFEETVIYLNKVMSYQNKRCFEKQVHERLLAHLKSKRFEVSKIPGPTNRRDYYHLFYTDHGIVVLSHEQEAIPPAERALENSRLDKTRGAVIQLSTTQNWDEEAGEGPHVYAVIHTCKGTSRMIEVRNYDRLRDFFEVCTNHIITYSFE